jgi:beta-aspartyl-peptidase (threonine type)
VALDSKGNLAAGTSTGGMSDKEYGRIGDSPIIGAGTYAHNETVAVSATGHGEWFIRHAVAHDIHAMVEYNRWTVERAADFIIHRKFKYYDVNGGVIVLGKSGNVAMPFNTPGMYRGYLKSTGEREVKLYGEE